MRKLSILLVGLAACHRTPAPTLAALPTGVTRAMITQGDTVFNTKSCVRCHGASGVGSERGPNLTDQTWIHVDGSYESIVQLVTTGFTKAEQKDPQYRFTMNPRGGMNFTDEQIRAVAAYVWSLSHPAAK
jgi:cytochrome c553